MFTKVKKLSKKSKGVELYNKIFVLSVCRMVTEKDVEIAVLKGSSDRWYVISILLSFTYR
jgi:hypothetical protein